MRVRVGGVLRGLLSSGEVDEEDDTAGRFCSFMTGVACLPEKPALDDLKRTTRWFLLMILFLSIIYVDPVTLTILPLKGLNNSQPNFIIKILRKISTFSGLLIFR